jgi:ribosome recycling factor
LNTTDNQTDEEKASAKKIRIPFSQLTQEEREDYFRVKSAKTEKKRNEAMKNKKEELVRKLLYIEF